MKRQKQLNLIPPPSLEFGGELRKGKRKQARPIDSKRAIHVVMRSSKAMNERSLLKAIHRKKIQSLLEIASKRFHVKVYSYANSGNHLHLLVKCKKKRDFQNFMRFLAGGIAFFVTKAKKTKPFGRFWDHLAYTRVVDWGKPFRIVKQYLDKNWIESAGGSVNLALYYIREAGLKPSG